MCIRDRSSSARITSPRKLRQEPPHVGDSVCVERRLRGRPAHPYRAGALGKRGEEVLVRAVVSDRQDEVPRFLREPERSGAARVDAGVLHLEHLVSLEHAEVEVAGEMLERVAQLPGAQRADEWVRRTVVPHQRELLLLQERSGRAVDEALQYRSDAVLPVASEGNESLPVTAALLDPCLLYTSP